MPLMRHFVQMTALRSSCHRGTSAETVLFPLLLMARNIRELQNLVERAVILSNDGVLHNPLHKAEVRPIVSFSEMLRDSERALLVETLESVGWVIAGPNGAATKMGLARTTLLAKMKRLSISKRQRFGIPNGPERTGAPLFTLA